MLRSKQRDAAQYGELEERVRRDIRRLQLDRSLGRIIQPNKAPGSLVRRVWHDPVWSTVIATGIVAALTALVGVHFDWWSTVRRAVRELMNRL